MKLDTFADLQTHAQGLYESARARYDVMAAAVLPVDDAESAEIALTFRQAIGEISPEEAIGGLLRWMREVGKQPRNYQFIRTDVP